SLKSEHPFGVDLKDVTFEVRSGEILGIAGVAGNGQIELMEALIGERPTPKREEIILNGEPIGDKGPQERRKLGMCFVPEERLG
ncbi:ATP-binding cassette domain-containing protein, partial [Acinetobacter baumannii]